jgi:molybdopterin converting factor small subunit
MKLGSEIIETSNNLSFSEFKEILRNTNPIFSEVFKDESVKYFLNLTEIIDPLIYLKDGDEIAFLPPVTGG